MSEISPLVPDVETLAQRLAGVDYLVDEGLATSMFLALRLPQPLLLEGEAGVGKTEAARSLAAVLDTPLIRLQCYEGIDSAEALYEWNYPRQLLSIRLADSGGSALSEEDLFGPDYLIRRPLLRALEHPGPRPAVLLIDEIDRADDDFEAFLLELLAEASVTIPELGTVVATHPPIIVLTSNRTRDLHDAVKRRCLYHWIAYPTPEREVEIVRRRVKGCLGDAGRPGGGRGLAHARLRRAEAAGDRRGHRLAGRPASCSGSSAWMPAAVNLHPRLGAQVRRGSGGDPRGRPRGARAQRVTDFGVETVELDLPPLAAALSRRLHEAGVPMTPERPADFARALTLVRPLSRRRLYWTARGVFVSDHAQVKAFDAVFFSIFGERADDEPIDATDVPADPAPPDDPPNADRRDRLRRCARDVLTAHGERRWRGRRRGRRPGWRWPATRRCSAGKSFDALDARRAGSALPVDDSPRAGHAAAAHPPLRERAPRPEHRHAADPARQPAHRGRPEPPRAPAPAHLAPPARDAVRISRVRWSPTPAPTFSS